MNNSGIWVIPNAPTAHNSKLNIPNSKFKKLLAILTDRQQPENKKYLDYDYQVPAEGVEPSQRALPGAG